MSSLDQTTAQGNSENPPASGIPDASNGHHYPDAPAVPIPNELSPDDRKELEGSLISAECIAATGYVTITESAPLEALGFPRSQWIVPAMLVTLRGADGEPCSYQIKPHQPRELHGKRQKYENRKGDRAAWHCNPTVRHLLDDPTEDLYITEGVKKADSLASKGKCAIAITGVWNWKGTNEKGGSTALASFNDIAWKGKDQGGNPIQRRVFLVFDSDAREKPEVNKALKQAAAYFAHRGAKVFFTHLPSGASGAKIGVDDFFAQGGTPELLHLHTTDKPPRIASTTSETETPLTPDEIRHTLKETAAQLSAPISLQQTKDVYRKWLHIEDDGLIEVVLGTVAANLMDGDPVWLMVIDRSGGGKTEHIQPLAVLPFVHLAATVTEPALLSGTPQKDAAKDSKGGLLREVGPFGFLILKDFTSILSMHPASRASTIAALREIYDGHWSRRTGSDGGRELEWRGKLSVIAACTEAIDNHHAVIGSMGERFAFYRLPPSNERALARKALAANGKEEQMRRELGQAVAGLFAGLSIPATARDLTEADTERLIDLASFTARCRSAVERDRISRDIEFAYKPEAPTRIAKVFARIFHGMSVIGVEKPRIWAALRKMALDSMHKTRRGALVHLATSGQSLPTSAVAVALDLPTKTVHRALEELNTHGILSRYQQKGMADVWTLTEGAQTLWNNIHAENGIGETAISSNDISNISKGDLDKDFQENKTVLNNASDIAVSPAIAADREGF